LSYVEEHLEKWDIQIANQVPHRKVKTLVIDISGKSVCVTRFFRPLAPPGKIFNSFLIVLNYFCFNFISCFSNNGRKDN
jgi:hypothetical protein